MLILFDHVTPGGIAPFLEGHTVTKAKERGWDTLTNGDLLRKADRIASAQTVAEEKSPSYHRVSCSASPLGVFAK